MWQQRKNEAEGSLTVFYAAVFSSLILALMALLSLGRVWIMRSSVRKDMDLSAFAVMAEYQKDWAEDYGLFMMPQDKLASSMNFYMNQNGTHISGDLKYSDLLVTPQKTLADPQVLEDQILELMKERGWLNLMEEVIDLLQNTKDESQEAKELKESVGGTDGSAALWEIQTYYGSLITDMEGIRSDGMRETYYVNGLLVEDPALWEIESYVARMEEEAASLEGEEERPEAFRCLSSHELGEMERAAYWIEEAKDKCVHARSCMEEIETALQEMSDENREKVEALLPFDVEDLGWYEAILEENALLCEDCLDALNHLIEMLDSEPPGKEAVTYYAHEFRKIEAYDTSISLPYEYRPKNNSLDLGALIEMLKGYPDNLEALAPKEEKEMELLYADMGSDLEMARELSDLDFGEGFESAFLTAEYVMGFYRNFAETIAEDSGEKTENLRGAEKKNRFFKNEVEYVLAGKDSEYKNVNSTRQRILLMREILNMGYLLSDAEKRETIEALAATTGGILLPGTGDLIAFMLITTAWSMAESIVDYRTLIQGGEVPLIKTASSWKTDLESVLSSSFDQEEDGGEEGGMLSMDYGQYLRIFLYLTPREERLGRIQELLYLNHQEFELEDAVTDFRVIGSVSGSVTMDFEAEYGFYE